MDIKLELLKDVIADVISQRMDILNADEIADSKALKMLGEIADVIRNNELNDFEVVEKIVLIFEENSISAGARHDFG